MRLRREIFVLRRLVLFFPDGLQFRNPFKIFWPAGGGFEVNEFLQIHVQALDAEHVDFFGKRLLPVLAKFYKHFQRNNFYLMKPTDLALSVGFIYPLGKFVFKPIW